MYLDITNQWLYGSMLEEMLHWSLRWNFTEMEGHCIYLGITLMSTHRSQILMSGCIDWTRPAIEVEVLFNHQPFIDVSVFCWLQNLFRMSIDLHVQHPELSIAHYHAY